MKSATDIYTFALETDEDRAEVDVALERLSEELELAHALRLKKDHRGRVTVPGVDSAETWAAMERAVPDWPQIFQPRLKN